jgi:hypothetical protein
LPNGAALSCFDRLSNWLTTIVAEAHKNRHTLKMAENGR